MADAERVLKPANENAWYVLMTLYGEVVNTALHEKNRAAWNAWSCQAMGDRARTAAVSSMVTFEELMAWPYVQAEVTERHEREMLRRNKHNPEFAYPGLPDAMAIVDLSGVNFEHPLLMQNTVFSGWALFNSATFRRGAQFDTATFNGYVGFNRATFCDHAAFNRVTFDGDAAFGGATFVAEAKFDSATFSTRAAFGEAMFKMKAWFAYATFTGIASFSNATFSGEAEFGLSTFSGFVYFDKAKFGASSGNQRAGFTNCQFEKPISFHNAIFHSCYPDFADAVLHDKTAFTADADHWPKSVGEPVDAKASCAVIRHNLGKQGLPEAEHFFFRREMGFAAQIGGWWERLPYRLFGAASDYGYSIARPAIALFWVWFLPALVFAAFRVTGVLVSDVAAVLWSGALSFANLFPLFGFHRVWFYADKLAALSPWLKALSGGQTVMSLPLLFFLGLGLRTRFRMR